MWSDIRISTTESFLMVIIRDVYSRPFHKFKWWLQRWYTLLFFGVRYASMYLFGFTSAFCFHAFSLFFFSYFFQVAVVDYSPVNSARVHYSRTIFSNFFIKNGFHSTIHTFKNYFVTVFSVFSKNKLYPNKPLIWIFVISVGCM